MGHDAFFSKRFGRTLVWAENWSYAWIIWVFISRSVSVSQLSWQSSGFVSVVVVVSQSELRQRFKFRARLVNYCLQNSGFGNSTATRFQCGDLQTKSWLWSMLRKTATYTLALCLETPGTGTRWMRTKQVWILVAWCFLGCIHSHVHKHLTLTLLYSWIILLQLIAIKSLQ